MDEFYSSPEQNIFPWRKNKLVLLYGFFWVISPGVNFICRRFRTLCLFHLHTNSPMKVEQGVSKRRRIKFRCRGITQKKPYNIQNTAKVWNQEYIYIAYNQSKFEKLGSKWNEILKNLYINTCDFWSGNLITEPPQANNDEMKVSAWILNVSSSSIFQV